MNRAVEAPDRGRQAPHRVRRATRHPLFIDKTDARSRPVSDLTATTRNTATSSITKICSATGGGQLDYTSGALDGYDKEAVAGLLEDRLRKPAAIWRKRSKSYVRFVNRSRHRKINKPLSILFIKEQGDADPPWVASRKSSRTSAMLNELRSDSFCRRRVGPLL